MYESRMFKKCRTNRNSIDFKEEDDEKVTRNVTYWLIAEGSIVNASVNMHSAHTEKGRLIAIFRLVFRLILLHLCIDHCKSIHIKTIDIFVHFK